MASHGRFNNDNNISMKDKKLHKHENTTMKSLYAMHDLCNLVYKKARHIIRSDKERKGKIKLFTNYLLMHALDE